MIKIIIKWTAIIMAVLLLIKIILVPFGIGFFALNTAKELTQKTFNSDNILQNYEWFYDYNAQYQARTAQLKTYSSYLKNETDKQERNQLRTEVNAMQQSCRNLVTKYNANSQKLNRKLFKSNNLPNRLSLNKCNNGE